MSETKLTPQIFAMYLGCRVFVPENGKVGELTGINWHRGITTIIDVQYGAEAEDWDVFNELDDVIDRVKPILRRLEDMTEEEAIECGVRGAWCDLEFDGTWRSNQFTTKAFIGLLSKSFDLFGLIDAGLAIDSKTLKP